MITEVLAAYAKATARQFTDRENTVGASEVGQCARRVFYGKNSGDPVYGASSDEDYADPWGAALRGRLFEDYFWVPALRARFGAELLCAGDQQQTFVSGFLSATTDGLLIDQSHDALASLGIAGIGGDGSIVVECKTIDPRIKLDGRSRSTHSRHRCRSAYSATDAAPARGGADQLRQRLLSGRNNRVCRTLRAGDLRKRQTPRRTNPHRAGGRSTETRKGGLPAVANASSALSSAHAASFAMPCRQSRSPSCRIRNSSPRLLICHVKPSSGARKRKRRWHGNALPRKKSAKRPRANGRAPRRWRRHHCRLVASQGSTFLRHESNSRGGRKSWPRPRRIRDDR